MSALSISEVHSDISRESVLPNVVVLSLEQDSGGRCDVGGTEVTRCEHQRDFKREIPGVLFHSRVKKCHLGELKSFSLCEYKDVIFHFLQSQIISPHL